MNKRIIVLSGTIVLMAITAAVTYSFSYRHAMKKFNNMVAGINERHAMYNKLGDIDQVIRQEYIDEIDEAYLKESLCNGYINGLKDSSCEYLTSAEYKLCLANRAGKTVNSGIDIIKNECGYIEVINVANESAAQEAGIKVGDIILKINNIDVKELSYTKCVRNLTGSIGSHISLSITRPSNINEKSNIDLNLKKYQGNPIDHHMINENVGYLAIHKFTNESVQSFYNAIDELQYQGAQGFIIDIRNNNIGDINNVAKILDKILPAGDIISKIDKASESKILYTSSDEEFSLPIAILINNETIGAAEIFASAIKDYNKGTIIGENTKGQTVENKIVPLSDGTAVNLPIAHYVTPNSGIITNVGLAPNIYIEMPIEAKYRLERRNLNVEDDNQLQEAIKTLNIPNDLSIDKENTNIEE